MAVNNQLAEQSHKAAFRLRTARSEEVGAIQAVARESWEATYSVIILPEIQASFIAEVYSPQSLNHSISREGQDHWFRVAEEISVNPAIIGFAEVHLRPAIAPDAELARIYVRPGYQKKGVGKALLEALIEELRALRPGLRPPRLRLSVAAENHQAIAFNEQRGFQYVNNFEANLPGQTLALQEFVLEI